MEKIRKNTDAIVYKLELASIKRNRNELTDVRGET